MSKLLTRPRRLLLTVSLIISAQLSGCAGLPEPTERAAMMTLPALAQTLTSARSSSSISGHWPAPAWWEVFAMPTLNRVIETALTDNPSLKIVAARLRQSQALVDAQAAELYPTITAQVSFSAQRFSANSTQAKLAGEHFRQLLVNPLALRYHLDLWGRDEATLQAVISQSQAHEIELANARILLSVSVAQSYFELAATAEKLKLAQNIAACHKRLMALVRARVASGLAAPSQIVTAQIQLHDAQQQITAARTELELQKNLIATLAGKGPDWARSLIIDSDTPPKSLELPEDLPLHLLAHRPDVRAARLHVDAAAQTIKVAQTAFYPDVNLVAFSGLHSISMTDVLLQGASLAYAVGPSVELPIFEGGRLRAELNYREAAYDAAVEHYNSQLLRAVQDVADALSRWQDLNSRLSTQRQLVTTARHKQNFAESLQRAGLGDLRAPLYARIAEYRHRLQLTQLQGAYFKAAAAVIQALGGGYYDNMSQ